MRSCPRTHSCAPRDLQRSCVHVGVSPHVRTKDSWRLFMANAKLCSTPTMREPPSSRAQQALLREDECLRCCYEGGLGKSTTPSHQQRLERRLLPGDGHAVSCRLLERGCEPRIVLLECFQELLDGLTLVRLPALPLCSMRLVLFSQLFAQANHLATQDSILSSKVDALDLEVVGSVIDCVLARRCDCELAAVFLLDRAHLLHRTSLNARLLFSEVLRDELVSSPVDLFGKFGPLFFLDCLAQVLIAF
mmetsp:Transcript_19617/g.49567  ORF Transcript_19617/g.49567 Transcript_19617/m.49567 type:complete len:248 (+) Transcript_19617:121-864(+)